MWVGHPKLPAREALAWGVTWGSVGSAGGPGTMRDPLPISPPTLLPILGLLAAGYLAALQREQSSTPWSPRKPQVSMQWRHIARQSIEGIRSEHEVTQRGFTAVTLMEHFLGVGPIKHLLSLGRTVSGSSSDTSQRRKG